MKNNSKDLTGYVISIGLSAIIICTLIIAIDSIGNFNSLDKVSIVQSLIK